MALPLDHTAVKTDRLRAGPRVDIYKRQLTGLADVRPAEPTDRQHPLEDAVAVVLGTANQAARCAQAYGCNR